MWPAFDKAMERFAELEKQLSDPEIVSNHLRYTELAKELGRVSKMVQPYKEFKKIDDELAQAESMKESDDDEEMQAMVDDEIATLQTKKQELIARMEDLLLTAGEDYSSIIMEIRAGTGGDEAALFAGNLFEMYSHYARDHNWKIETISFSPGEQGGFKEIIFSVNGDEVYQQFQYEGGGHRVQRVPKTETQGRVHTSAATVAVLPEPDAVQVVIKDDDLEWERMRASGAGGQHVNKTESAVRIWYKRGTSEEIEVKCQDERSQHKNRDRAMRILRSRIFDRQKEAAHEERAEQRRVMVGSGDRSQRIRTYNFPQNRLTDHRINLTLYKLDAIIGGDMSELVSALKEADKKRRLGESGDGAA